MSDLMTTTSTDRSCDHASALPRNGRYSPRSARSIDIFRETSLRAGVFQGITPSVISALSGRMERASFPLGHHIFREGDDADLLYIIRRGKVKVSRAAPYGRQRVTALLGPTDMFGELALFDPGPRTSTVTTLTRVHALTLTRSELTSWTAAQPEISELLLRLIARRLRRTDNALNDLIFVDVAGRVAKLLLELASRFGEHDNDVIRINHELNQAEFAQLVGSTRETVNRALCAFVDRGWIRTYGKAVVLYDPAALARRAK
jgi:CRP/FNR family transcriptional regulator, cyclic AMP receptor protein